MRDMTFIDNHKGVSLQTSGDRDLIKIRMKDSEIYGEGENDDCPVGQECWCEDKYGLMLFGNN